MACNCRGGPTCCMRVSTVGFGPYKCPDCGVWWSGFEHRCAKPDLSTSTNWGHCHGCMTMMCQLPDDQPCMLHAGGDTITNQTQWDPINKVWFTYN